MSRFSYDALCTVFVLSIIFMTPEVIVQSSSHHSSRRNFNNLYSLAIFNIFYERKTEKGLKRYRRQNERGVAERKEVETRHKEKIQINEKTRGRQP